MYLGWTTVWVYKILTSHLNGLVGFGKLDRIHQPLVPCLTVGIRHTNQVRSLWREKKSSISKQKNYVINLIPSILRASLHILYLSCSFSEATQGLWGWSDTVSKCRHISSLAVLRNTCHRLSQDLHRTKKQCKERREERGMLRMLSTVCADWLCVWSLELIWRPTLEFSITLSMQSK